MKINRSFFVLVACLVVAIFAGTFIIRLLFFSATPSVSSDSENRNIGNIQLAASNTNNPSKTMTIEQPDQYAKVSSINTSENTNAPSEAAGFFKTVINPQSGQYAIVDSGREVVIIKDKNNNVILATNMVELLGNGPTVGERKIGSMQLVGSNLIIYVAKECFSINTQTGEIKDLGAN